MCGKITIHLVEIIEEHESHLVDGHRGVDRTRQTQPPHSHRQRTKVSDIGVGEEHRVNLGDDLLQVLDELRGQLLVPAAVQEEVEPVHLQEITVGRLVTSTRDGIEPDD